MSTSCKTLKSLKAIRGLLMRNLHCEQRRNQKRVRHIVTASGSETANYSLIIHCPFSVDTQSPVFTGEIRTNISIRALCVWEDSSDTFAQRNNLCADNLSSTVHRVNFPATVMELISFASHGPAVMILMQ